ncbi:hypothetical protein L2E82_39265 [Cichorium intybus]|uniref:Uncharacterized protein n=1 Tax=Cichorium intybus TaxID=13427 RepID=A0ACB9AJG8_CICIN|nr:hypothetical protein L2E82_39265 [Cichorium intybus]
MDDHEVNILFDLFSNPLIDTNPEKLNIHTHKGLLSLNQEVIGEETKKIHVLDAYERKTEGLRSFIRIGEGRVRFGNLQCILGKEGRRMSRGAMTFLEEKEVAGGQSLPPKYRWPSPSLTLSFYP